MLLDKKTRNFTPKLFLFFVYPFSPGILLGENGVAYIMSVISERPRSGDSDRSC